MQQKVWDKSVKDTLGLKTYFYKNKLKYAFKELSKNKGQVMNDYQEYLEQELIALLQKKYSVKIKKKALKKLTQQYNSNE